MNLQLRKGKSNTPKMGTNPVSGPMLPLVRHIQVQKRRADEHLLQPSIYTVVVQYHERSPTEPTFTSSPLDRKWHSANNAHCVLKRIVILACSQQEFLLFEGRRALLGLLRISSVISAYSEDYNSLSPDKIRAKPPNDDHLAR